MGTPLTSIEAHTVSPESVGMSSQRLAKAVGFVARAVDEGILPLADLVIARRGLQSAHTLGDHSIFYLASLTKVLIATLIMRQVERGVLLLEEPVATFLPDFAQRDKQHVTLRHLLSHSSGLPDTMPFMVLVNRPRPELVAEICRQTLVYPPGLGGGLLYLGLHPAGGDPGGLWERSTGEAWQTPAVRSAGNGGHPLRLRAPVGKAAGIRL